MDSVLGLTIANDLSERVLQGQDGTFNGNFTRAKSFDTFCPLGPVIQTNFEQNPELGIKCFVNDELNQDGNTKDMISNFDGQTAAMAENTFIITNNGKFGIDTANGVLTNVALSEGDIMMLDVSIKAVDDGTDELLIIDLSD